MPWKIVKRDEQFCVVAESDGETVKCHPTREKAKSHLAALYVNEPSAAKKSLNTGYGLLKSLIVERVEELKACGANKPGGGGFSAGNTCARGGKGSSTSAEGGPDTSWKDGKAPPPFDKVKEIIGSTGNSDRDKVRAMAVRGTVDTAARNSYGGKELKQDSLQSFYESKMVEFDLNGSGSMTFVGRTSTGAISPAKVDLASERGAIASLLSKHYGIKVDPNTSYLKKNQ